MDTVAKKNRKYNIGYAATLLPFKMEHLAMSQ